MRLGAAVLAALFLFAGCENVPPAQSAPSTIDSSTASSQSRKQRSASHSFFAMDTYLSLTIYGGEDDPLEELLREGEALCRAVEAVFSPTMEGSEMLDINRSSQLSVPISEEMEMVLGEALRFAELSGGAYDPTVGTVSRLWDFGMGEGSKPDPAALEAALPRVGYRQLSIREHVLYREQEGIILDLGGIAKGYAGDSLRDFFLQNGVESGILSLGGDVVTFGIKPDGSPWRVGIAKPFAGADDLVATLKVEEGAVVTSGNYQRYFREGDMLYHHILDPTTGWPVQNDLQSVTVLAPTAMEADALSTICFVLGSEEGLRFLEEYDGAEGAFYTSDGKFHNTTGLKGLQKR